VQKQKGRVLESHSPLAQRLSAHVELSDVDRNLIRAATGKTVRTAVAHHDIVREGDRPLAVKVILDGWAMRYKQLPDGRRQILALMIPGDLGGANAFVQDAVDHSIAALTPLRYAEIARSDFETLMESSPRIAKALWWSSLVTVSIQREWTTNIGQRQAYERIAHLLCETFTRLQSVGLTRGDSCEFPLTQGDIADATGLTPVHVNRMIQAMRQDGLLELRNKRLTIRDYPKLRQVAMFNPAYLHLGGGRSASATAPGPAVYV
jgi:CRP-like cAMP-binding protein